MAQAARKDKPKEAAALLQEAANNLKIVVHLDPHSARGYDLLGQVEHEQGKPKEAAAALAMAAWVLATSPRDAMRNGRRAVDLATEVARETGGRDPQALDTLAAAYAEVGDFSRAMGAGTAAFKIATQQGETRLAVAIGARLDLYRQGRPFRDERPDASEKTGGM
jgi:tetratricopeptide (TPR) repeat protein